MRKWIASIFCLFATLATPAIAPAADTALPTGVQGVGVDEKPDALLPLDTVFINELGHRVKLRDCLIPGKPAILQLSYFDCPMLCDVISQGAMSSIDDVDLEIGADFNFINISFNPHDTSADAYQKKKQFVSRSRRTGAGPGMQYLVGDKEAIAAITQAVGYKYKWLEESQQFSHPAVLMIITPEGHVSRYLYGVEFPQKTLRLSLVEASEGKIGTAIDQVLIYCFNYDSETGKYRWAAVGLMRMGGIAVMLVLGIWIAVMIRKNRRAEAT